MGTTSDPARSPWVRRRRGIPPDPLSIVELPTGTGRFSDSTWYRPMVQNIYTNTGLLLAQVTLSGGDGHEQQPRITQPKRVERDDDERPLVPDGRPVRRLPRGPVLRPVAVGHPAGAR